jgi:nitronate monooxygenase
MALPPLLQHLRLPLIGAPLFIVSNPALVIAQCKAGIVGSFPALNARTPQELDDWLRRPAHMRTFDDLARVTAALQ